MRFIKIALLIFFISSTLMVFSKGFNLTGYWRISDYSALPSFNGMSGFIDEKKGEGYVYYVHQNDYHFAAGQLWFEDIVKQNDSTYNCNGMFRYTNGNFFYDSETIKVIDSVTIRIIYANDNIGMVFKRFNKTNESKYLKGKWTYIAGNQNSVFLGMQGEVKETIDNCVITHVDNNVYNFINGDIWWKDFSVKSDSSYSYKNLWRWTDGFSAYGTGTLTFLGDDFLLAESSVLRNGTTSSGYYFLIRENNDKPTAISKIDEQKCKIYPNPVSKMLYIELGGNALTKIQLFTNNGMLVYQTFTRNSDISIPVSGFNEGIYILSISNNISKTNKQIIKIK